MPDRKLVDDPEFWRSRAEVARAMAQEMKDRHSKAIMDRIADDYESTRPACRATPKVAEGLAAVFWAGRGSGTALVLILVNFALGEKETITYHRLLRRAHIIRKD